jgi:tRNA-2-methylthio-N6-dimethylallyladenosine synthase
MKIHVLTFGCQMNKYDSEMVAGLLQNGKVEFVEDLDSANALIINTCSVRGHAEDRVYNRLHLLKARKRRDPSFVLAVMGCMAQKEGEQIARKFPWVDLVVGTRMLDQFPSLLARVREGEPTPLLAIDHKPMVSFGETVARRENKSLAYLAVMRGCNKRCTYCVVPFTRGPEISRPIAEIVTEARRLVDDGVIEIMLLGQTIDTYGRDLAGTEAGTTLLAGTEAGTTLLAGAEAGATLSAGRDAGTTLSGLLRALCQIDGLRRIRFITSHPRECRPELFATMAELSEKVMPFVHMPPQSGSDRMLKRMARGYTRQRYVDVISAAREACPQVEFCGDWIVGFSGETEEDFAQSLSLLEQVRFQHSFVFKYSVREGTPAQKLPDDVPEEVKKQRHAILAEAQERISLEKNQARVGQIEDVLVECVSKSNAARLTGRTSTYRLIHFPGDAELIGKIVRVKVVSATALALTGELQT